jgi:hypothetical protein
MAYGIAKELEILAQGQTIQGHFSFTYKSHLPGIFEVNENVGSALLQSPAHVLFRSTAYVYQLYIN